MTNALIVADRISEWRRLKALVQLVANWDSLGCTWWLQYGQTVEGVLRPEQECIDVFKAVTRSALLGLPSTTTDIRANSGPRAPDDAEPWQVWLDFMRFSGWNFRETSSPTACTEFEWDAGVKDGKPLTALRREQKYTTGDEWKKVYRRTATGKLRRLSWPIAYRKNTSAVTKWLSEASSDSHS